MPKESIALRVIFGIGALVAGIHGLFYPRVPPFSGRWAVVDQFIYETFGIYGGGAVYVIAGFYLMIFAFKKRREIKRV